MISSIICTYFKLKLHFLILFSYKTAIGYLNVLKYMLVCHFYHPPLLEWNALTHTPWAVNFTLSKGRKYVHHNNELNLSTTTVRVQRKYLISKHKAFLKQFSRSNVNVKANLYDKFLFKEYLLFLFSNLAHTSSTGCLWSTGKQRPWILFVNQITRLYQIKQKFCA